MRVGRFPFFFLTKYFDLQRLYAKTKIQKISLLEMFFVDDAAVCATSENDHQIILQTFHKIFQVFGLQMAITKTEVLFQRPKTQPDLPDPQILICIDSIQLQELCQQV